MQDQKCRSTEDEDMDLMLGDGHNYNKTDVRRRYKDLLSNDSALFIVCYILFNFHEFFPE